MADGWQARQDAAKRLREWGETAPDWALDRAKTLSGGEWQPNEELRAKPRMASPAFFALARYIATHEDPPVDPLLLEAREICSQQNPGTSSKYLAGVFDATISVRSALAGLRRGIEIGKEQADG